MLNIHRDGERAAALAEQQSQCDLEDITVSTSGDPWHPTIKIAQRTLPAFSERQLTTPIFNREIGVTHSQMGVHKRTADQARSGESSVMGFTESEDAQITLEGTEEIVDLYRHAAARGRSVVMIPLAPVTMLVLGPSQANHYCGSVQIERLPGAPPSITKTMND